MKRISLFVFLSSLVVSPMLLAETVLIYTFDEWISPRVRRGEAHILSSLEDGMMEVFFDAGHIVYNGQAPPQVRKTSVKPIMDALLLASKGGARVIVEVSILYDSQAEELSVLPAEVVFTLTEAVVNRVLLEGRLFPRDFQNSPQMDSRETCRSLGAALAERVLAKM